MERAIIVRGRFEDSLHVTLAEPVEDLQGEVEVVLRPVPQSLTRGQTTVFDLIRALPAGRRTKLDIDSQVRDEKEAWERR